MGIKLSELNFSGDSLHIGIDGFILDPLVQNLGVINPEDFKKVKETTLDLDLMKKISSITVKT